jgi:hypothetical protein
MMIVKLFVLLPLIAVTGQMYSYAVTRQKEEKQKVCRALGITFFSLGTVSLVSHEVLYVFAGLFLMMVGFRLIAHGLDRLDKKVFIDRYDASNTD